MIFIFWVLLFFLIPLTTWIALTAARVEGSSGIFKKLFITQPRRVISILKITPKQMPRARSQSVSRKRRNWELKQFSNWKILLYLAARRRTKNLNDGIIRRSNIQFQSMGSRRLQRGNWQLYFIFACLYSKRFGDFLSKVPAIGNSK